MTVNLLVIIPAAKPSGTFVAVMAFEGTRKDLGSWNSHDHQSQHGEADEGDRGKLHGDDVDLDEGL